MTDAVVRTGRDEPESTSLAPVVIFAYMRPDHLARTIESLRANPESAATHVIFYCDGPRNAAHQAGVNAVRRIVERASGFASIRRIYREQNVGLADSVVAGVSEVLNEYGQAIVLEDDLVLSPHFLRYMNDGLAQYAGQSQVASIHGYCYPTPEPLPETFFLRGADCWGWATWSRAWSVFQADGRALLEELLRRKLSRNFDLDGAYPYTSMLRDQVQGRNSSWAIRWHAACFLREMLTLYPGRSLVENLGNDSSGTHCATSDAFTQTIAATPVRVQSLPLVPSKAARQAFITFLRERRSFTRRAQDWLAHLRNQAG